MSLFDYRTRQIMIKTLGCKKQAVYDDGSIDGKTIYCMFFNPGEIIDIGNQQIIAEVPSLVVDRDDVFISGEWLIKSGNPGTEITVDAQLYTATNRAQEDAGFVTFEMTEG